jgi:hypothetical protein
MVETTDAISGSELAANGAVKPNGEFNPEKVRALLLARHIQRMENDPEYRKTFLAARLKDHLCNVADAAIRRSIGDLLAGYGWTSEVRFA